MIRWRKRKTVIKNGARAHGPQELEEKEDGLKRKGKREVVRK